MTTVHLIYGVMDESGEAVISNYLVVAWAWSPNGLASPVTLAHLPPVCRFKDVFLYAQPLGYAIDKEVYDLDGCVARRSALEKEFKEVSSEKFKTWSTKFHPSVMPNA